MAAYIARRFVFIVLVLVAVSMLVFGITALLPANVAYLILGAFAPPEQVRALELKLGLNDPIWSAVSALGRRVSHRQSRRVSPDESPDCAHADGGVGPLADADRDVIRPDRRHRRGARRGRGAAPRATAGPRRIDPDLSGHRRAGILLGDRRHRHLRRRARLASGFRLRAAHRPDCGSGHNTSLPRRSRWFSAISRTCRG